MDMNEGGSSNDSFSQHPSPASYAAALNLSTRSDLEDERSSELSDEMFRNQEMASDGSDLHLGQDDVLGPDEASINEGLDTTNAFEEEGLNSSDINEEPDNEEGEEGLEEEEDFVSDEEEFEESLDNEEEGSKSASASASASAEEEKSRADKEIEAKRGLMSLYSGMNDIISESSSISSSPASTPSVTPTKNMGNGASRLQAALTSSLSYKSSGGGLLVHHPVTPKKRVINKANTDHLSEELSLGYRILMELMSDYQKGSNAPFMEPIEMDREKNGDYLEVVEKPMWLKKIKEQLVDGKYTSVTELVGDTRVMLENAYRYHGPAHSISKKGLRLEHMMEQKIALLPKEVRELCSLERTSGTPPEDITQKHRNKTARISVNGDNFFSYVLYRVRGCRVNRDKEMKKRRMEAMRQAKRDREHEVVVWEEDLLKEPLHTHMRAMWELPQVGHFIFLTLKTLNIYEVPQFELERMLLMPQASRTLAMLLTSLLSSPQQRQKLSEKPYMPYKVWARKLAHKTLLWYRCFSRENQDCQKVFDQMGIEPNFWSICGPSNPFDRQLFHEMSFHQRVWLLKSLCDYLLNNHKTVQEVISDQPEVDQREYNLGRDRNGNEYLHFPQFCGQSLRIYRRARVPSPEVRPQEEDDAEGNILSQERIKEFRKMIKKFRNKYEEEAEWEGARGKKKKKKKRANRAVDPEEPPPVPNRSRPGNLRQRPRARYNDQYEDLGLSSDDEPKAKPKSKKSKLIECSSDEEDLLKENEPVDTPPPPAAPPEKNDAEDDTTNSNSLPATPQDSVMRAQQKNPRIKKGGKRKPTCELCGKSFHTIAALKGHRAVHTKEKKLASEAEANKKLRSDEAALEDKTEDSRDRFSSNGENSVAQNGECDFSGKSENVKDKSKDLKNESLVNGVIKEESDEAADKDDEDTKGKGSLVKKENSEDVKNSGVKQEVVDVKEEVKEETLEYVQDGEGNQCNGSGELDSTKIKSEDNQRTENGELTKSDVASSPSCNGSVAVQEEDETSSSKASTPVPPTESKTLHDPSPYLPRLEDFELVVTSVEQLRLLTKRFGDLPEGTKDDDEDTEETRPAEKRPSCEVKLHKALCNLLSELSPWETKLLTANKRLRTKLRNEWNDFVKRGDDYVDPAEEAWMSDPEPEPEPAATPQPSSSSSSSSEESLDEEGNPKRKLRKRRAKRQAVAQMMENVPPPVETPAAPVSQNPESYAVSSRGRVRKVKKIINYDGLDFEKLAMQASQEAEEEKVRRKRKREEDEKEREEQEEDGDSSNIASFGGVKRYLLSQSGHITSYIDNEGQVRSASAIKDNRVEKGKVDISSVRNLAGQLVTSAKKEIPKPPVRQHVGGIPSKIFQNTNIKPDVPSVVVAAYNNQGSPVYVRVVGEQALQLVKYMKPGTKGPVSQIKLQHHGQTYTVNTNAQIMTKNIPGIPNGESAGSPAPSVIRSTASASAPTSTLVVSRPSTGLGGLATSNSPAVPRVAPISTVVSSTPTPPNTLALAYRGLTRPTRPVTMTSGMGQPQGGSIVRGVLHPEHTRPTVATTRLVTASPSVVSSVMPPGARPSANVTSPVHVNHQVNRPTTSTVMASPIRPAMPQVVNRIAGVPTASAVATTVTSAVHQPVTAVVQDAATQQQVPMQTVISQPQGQAITAATVVVPHAGGQPQLKLESESLAQLMQRTGSKIVAMPNGRGGYTLSLTPGAVPPGQNSQTHIASNTAAKVQVVTGAPASLLQESSPTSPVQQQVIHQQTLSPSGGARPTAVVQGIQGIGHAGGVTHQAIASQQGGLRQVIPVNQTSVAGSVIKTNNVVTQGTQLVLNSGQQSFPRVATQQRVYSNLVAAQSTPQQTRTSTGTVTTVLAPQQSVNQQQTVVQHAVVQKGNTVQSQTPSFQAASPQQQYVVQQRVLAQPAGTHHQVVRLQQANPSQSGNAGQRLTVQIVQQPGGGQQVVQMVPQVVSSQANATAGQQSIIYVQGTGQVIAQQPKANLTAVQQAQTQPQLQSPQGQIAQQQVVHVSQPQQQQVVQIAQPQQQQVVQVAQSQQQQQVVQVAQSQQQQVVQVAQSQQQQVVHVAQPQQQQVVQVAQPQQQQVQVAQPQQQQQQSQGRLVLVRTQQGEQMALHHTDGRLTFLTQEQLQTAIRNNAITNQPAST